MSLISTVSLVVFCPWRDPPCGDCGDEHCNPEQDKRCGHVVVPWGGGCRDFVGYFSGKDE
jgi:hypothetical protein